MTSLFVLVSSGSARDVVDYLTAHPDQVDVANEKGDTPLIMAARRGDPDVVGALLTYRASVSKRNLKGSNPLIAAAMKGHAAICSMFLEVGADVNQCTDSHDTALSLAIWQNHTDVCILLMNAGANIDNIDKFGDTMLLDAAKHGNTAVMQKLLDTSAILIDHANKKGDTALIRAAWKGEIGAVQLLLDRGAKPQLANAQGCTALLTAAIHDHRECFSALLEKSDLTVLNAVDEAGNNALYYLASFASSAREEPFWTGMRKCIERGCALDTPADMGELLLCRAANSGRVDVVKALLERGVDVNFCDVNNRSRSALLAHLQSQADIEIVNLLLDNGASINQQDSDGNTALILAVRQNLSVIVELLLSRGASLSAETTKGETALSLAAQHGPTSRCLELLTERTAAQLGWNTLLLHAASHCDTNKISGFISGANPEIDLDYTDTLGRSALILSAKNGSVACVKLLLEAGVNHQLVDRDGCTALVTAIRAGHKDVAEVLAKWQQRYSTLHPNDITHHTTTPSPELENITRFLLRLGTKLSAVLDKTSPEFNPSTNQSIHQSINQTAAERGVM